MLVSIRVLVSENYCNTDIIRTPEEVKLSPLCKVLSELLGPADF